MKAETRCENRAWMQFTEVLTLKLAVSLLYLGVAAGAAQTYSVLHHFDGAQGWYPHGGLTVSGTTLFGTTFWGGAGVGTYGQGTVFKVNTDGRKSF